MELLKAGKPEWCTAKGTWGCHEEWKDWGEGEGGKHQEWGDDGKEMGETTERRCGRPSK